MNSLPKTVARQRCGYDLNPSPSANHLATELPTIDTIDAKMFFTFYILVTFLTFFIIFPTLTYVKNVTNRKSKSPLS